MQIALETESEQTIVNMGPQHPSTHGVLRLVLRMEGEVIAEADPVIGYLHRGVERLCQTRTYVKNVPFTDRLDYVASFSYNLGYCLAVERLAGLEIPERAQVIRVMAAELQRLASHLVWLGSFALDLGAWTVFLYAWRERELILDMFEMWVGARLTYHACRIGGVAADLPEGFLDRVREFVDLMPKRLNQNDALLTGNRIFVGRCREVGMLPPEVALDYGCCGPTLRGSGVAFDLRKAAPYSGYDRFDFDVAVEDGCDCLARYLVRIKEMRQSLRIIRQAVDALPEGPVMAKVPRVFKPEPGEAYARSEAPRGDLGVYVAGDGSIFPARVRFRAPCFANISALPYMLRGWKIADVVAILGSIDIVLGDSDR
jgi:NADH-quinone oxidoreductase subunit D